MMKEKELRKELKDVAEQLRNMAKEPWSFGPEFDELGNDPFFTFDTTVPISSIRETRNGNKIHPTAIIYDNVVISQNVEIGPYCVIGAPAESKAHEGKENFGVWIGNDVKIKGLCTIDGGAETRTYIGTGAYIMKQVHIGHDAEIKQCVTIAPGARIGGHAIIGAYCNIGMNATIHQRTRVFSRCMVGMGCVYTKKTERKSGVKYIGVPARILGPNVKHNGEEE